MPIHDDEGNNASRRALAMVGPGHGPDALPFSSVIRLVPHSGIQFVDFTLPTDRLALVQHRFIVESAAPGTDLPDVLVPLPAISDGDGLEWHPITRQPLRPEETRWLTGYDGVEAFLGRWLPLPYFRFIGRTPEGRIRFDKGPTNWARLYIAPPAGDLRSTPTLNAVLAFDTHLSADTVASADDAPAYLSPSPNDAQFGSTFLLSDEPEDLGEFLGEPWLDQWLTAALPRWQSSAQPRPKLDHLARYLALLKVLQTSRIMPEVRLVDTFSTRFPVTTENVDLVLDIGDVTTTALLLSSTADANPLATLSAARPLALRHLGRPTIVNEGPIATAVEFDDTPFGDAQASRKSGRVDAFLWPSMARVGSEALALQTRELATPGTTGLTQLRTRLTDIAPHTNVWRVARDTPLTATPGGVPGPAAQGVYLGHVTEDGNALPRLLTGPNAKGQAPALRPRFSQSAMMTQFVAELLLHAVSSLNAPHRGDGGERSAITLRQLDRVIVSTAASAPDDERFLLLQRTQDAVDIVWRALGWDHADRHIGALTRPRVVPGLGPDLAAQVVYVHDSVRQHFGNDAQSFVELTRRPRNLSRLSPDLRIASIDAGDDRTSLSIVDYSLSKSESSPQTALHSSQSRATQFAIGREHLVTAIAEAIVAPAITRALVGSGLDDGARFLGDIRGPWHLAAPINDPHFAPRLAARVILPAARSILADAIEASGRRGVEIETRLEALVARDLATRNISQRLHARPPPPLGGTTLAMMFDAATERAGGLGFRLADVVIRVRGLDVERITQPVLDRLVQPLTAEFNATDVDLVLLTGSLFSSPHAVDAVRSALPISASRLIEMGKGRYALIEALGTDFTRGDRTAAPRPWLTAAVGAYIASRSDDATQRASEVRTGTERQIADHRPPSERSPWGQP